MTEHHSSTEEQAIMQRFRDQGNGVAKQEFTDGKLSAEDEGSLAFAIAPDLDHHIVLIQFNKPVAWMGLNVESAKRLAAMLTKNITAIEDHIANADKS